MSSVVLRRQGFHRDSQSSVDDNRTLRGGHDRIAVDFDQLRQIFGQSGQAKDQID
jgi:hypothetical protein